MESGGTWNTGAGLFGEDMPRKPLDGMKLHTYYRLSTKGWGPGSRRVWVWAKPIINLGVQTLFKGDDGVNLKEGGKAP